MQIRQANADDHDQIGAILRAAFPGDDEARLVKTLRASGDDQYEWVAEETHLLTGCIILSPMRAPENTLGLGPLAVLPEHQRKGVGSALVRQSIQPARADGWRGIFLLGSPAYYGRFGFSVDAAERFKGPYPAEYMQALALHDGALADAGVGYRYAKAFETL